MSTRVKLDALDIYSFLDPAGKKKGTDSLKKVRANTALVTIGVDPLQRVIVLEAWRAKTSAAATTKQVFDTNERWHPKIFGCEANAMQELYADMLLMEAQRQMSESILSRSLNLLMWISIGGLGLSLIRFLTTAACFSCPTNTTSIVNLLVFLWLLWLTLWMRSPLPAR